MKIVADAHIPYINDYFASYGELVLKNGRDIHAEDVKDADILLVRSITRVDQSMLRSSSLKLVGSVTAGADHVDAAWLAENNIAYAVASGFNAPPVADYVVSIIAALQAKKVLGQKAKIALIGVGHVGRLVQSHLLALGFEVLLCDPLRAQQETDFISIPLQEIEGVDLISLHVPLTRSGAHPTYHFIDKTFLARQKSGCVLLNASRGAVINHEDLLSHGEHLHWCFDVWENEPNINKTILDKTLLATPHIAGYSVQSKIRGIDSIYRAACELGIIMPKAITPKSMPTQRLEFSLQPHHWQDIVLGVFNPLVMTAMMRYQLLNEDRGGRVFDEMRNQFNYRHEFAFTEVSGNSLDEQVIIILRKLGVQIHP